MSYNRLLQFPIGSYLMLRLDYLVICRDELEAKILRIIEMYTEMERQRIYQEIVNGREDTEDVVDVTREVWVPISHRLMMRDLYGTVKSENTLKRAIKSLLDKRFIFVRPVPGKYEALLYQIDVYAIEAEFEKVAALGIAGYQKLIPSKIDTIKSVDHQNLIPSEYQELTPSAASRVSEIDPHSRSNRESKKDTVERETYAASGDASTRASLAAEIEADLREDNAPDDDASDETVKRQATPGNVTAVSYSKETPVTSDSDGYTKGAPDGQLASSQQTTSADSYGAAPAPSSEQAPDGATSPVLAPSPLSRVGPRRRGKREDTPLKCEPAAVRALLDERRGYALEEKVAIIRERDAIKTWCGMHTLEEAVQVLDYLQKEDPFWKKPENKYRIGGLVLAKETPEVLAKRKRAETEEPKPYSFAWMLLQEQRQGLQA